MKHLFALWLALGVLGRAQAQRRYAIEVLPRQEDAGFYSYFEGGGKISEQGHALCIGTGETPGFPTLVCRTYAWVNGKYLVAPSWGNYRDNVAESMNDRGDVEVSSFENDGSNYVKYRWNYLTNTVTPTLTKMTKGAINNFGVTVGCVPTTGDNYVAASYNGSALTKLGTLGGATSCAYDINDAGMVVGEANIPTSQFRKTRAFVYQNGLMSALELGPTDYSNAKGVSGNGWITGIWSPDETLPREVYTYRNGIKTVYARKTKRIGEPRAINNSGTAIGEGDDGIDPRTLRPINPIGYVYHNGETLNLADISDAVDKGIQITNLGDINNRGQIVGTGWNGTRSVAFIAHPVPEPASWLALGAGFLAFSRKRHEGGPLWWRCCEH